MMSISKRGLYIQLDICIASHHCMLVNDNHSSIESSLNIDIEHYQLIASEAASICHKLHMHGLEKEMTSSTT